MGEARLREMGYRRQFQDLFPKLYPELNNDKNKLLTKNVTFVVTEGCNLACTYCYECHKDHAKVMSKETAKKAIDMILDDSKMEGYINSKETPSIIIEFIGGEPLLEIDLMDYICDYFRYKTYELNHPWANNHMFSITTNGVLWNTPEVQKFISKNKNRLSATITIDGNKELHDSCRIFPDGSGSYDIVFASIQKAMKQIGLDATKVTLAPENIEHISTAIPFLYSLGYQQINANVVYEDVWKDEHVPIYYNQLIKLADYILDNKLYEDAFCSLFDDTIGKPMSCEDNNNWCGGNGQMLAIGTDGRLFPCIRFMKYSLADQTLPEFEIGNIDSGIEKEQDNEYLQCLSCITRRSQSTDECWDCPVASGCSWCTAYNYDVFKTPNKRAIFICKMHKARVLANYYYWGRIKELIGIDKDFKLNLTPEDIAFIKGE